MTQRKSAARNAAGIAIAFAFVAGLYLGRELFIPLALALFFCFLLTPLANALERRLKFPRVLSSLLVVGAVFTIIGAFGWVVATQTSGMISEFPKYQSKFVAKIRDTRESVESYFKRATKVIEGISNGTKSNQAGTIETPSHPGAEGSGEIDMAATAEAKTESGDRIEIEEPVRVEVVPGRPDWMGWLGSVIGPVVHPLATIGAAIILLIFFLINRDDLRDRFIRACGQARIPVTTAALSDSHRRVMRFLGAQFFANCVIGCVTAIGLYFIGVPNAALWGLIAAVARLLPYLGAAIATLMPFALSLAIFDGWQTPLLVVAWCILVDALSANILEPLLYGARTGVSATAVLVSFMFWTWIWGGFGLFLATPITVCLVAIGKHVAGLEIIYILLSDEPVLNPATRFYQRILARAPDDATQIAQQVANESEPMAPFDQVVFPGAARLQYDQHAELMDDERLGMALKAGEDAIEAVDLKQWPEEPQAAASDAQRRRLVVITGPGFFDRLIPKLLEKIADRIGLDVLTISGDAFAGEVVEEIIRAQPGLVVFAAIEPRSINRFWHIYVKLRAGYRTVPVFVVVYSASQQSRKMSVRLARDCGLSSSMSMGEVVARLQSPSVSPTRASDADEPTDLLPTLVEA